MHCAFSSFETATASGSKGHYISVWDEAFSPYMRENDMGQGRKNVCKKHHTPLTPVYFTLQFCHFQNRFILQWTISAIFQDLRKKKKKSCSTWSSVCIKHVLMQYIQIVLLMCSVACRERTHMQGIFTCAEEAAQVYVAWICAYIQLYLQVRHVCIVFLKKQTSISCRWST